jgi:hypothetical protein
MTESPPSGWGAANYDASIGLTRMRPAPNDSRHQKWVRWLDEIEEDLQLLALSRTLWQSVNAIVADNPCCVGLDHL